MRNPLLILAACTASAFAAQTCHDDQTCPPPIWETSWMLNRSTITQPCNNSGFIDPRGARFNVLSFDWGNAMNVWGNNSAYKPKNTPCEEFLVEQAALVKAANPNAHVFVYRNLELALEWLKSERDAMYDDSKKDWFLQYTDGMGHKNGTIYNEPTNSTGVPLDQYFWDWRVPEMVDYWINNVVMGPGGTGAPGGVVDGVFTDDVQGIGEEHDSAAPNMNISATELQGIQDATHAAWQKMFNALHAAGKYNWQAFGYEDSLGMTPSNSTCIADMRTLCATPRDAVFTMQVPDWEPLFDLDVGVPLGECTESPTGVFSRKYTNGVVSLSCPVGDGNWTASLPFHY